MAKRKQKVQRVLPSLKIITPTKDEPLKVPVDDTIYAVQRPDWMMDDRELWQQLQTEIRLHALNNGRDCKVIKHKGGNLRVPPNRRSVRGFQFGQQPAGEYCIFL